jgi:hypothetical protein
MRYEHAAAIVAEGIKRGTRRHRDVALGVAAQLELTMRQADVIGVWERIGQTEVVEPGAIVESGRIWGPGLRFEDFAAGQLDLETLKNAGRAVFDVMAYPLFQEALAAVPATERHGPLVTDENRSPVSGRYYWDLYRDVADAAGIPRAVWNVRARQAGRPRPKRQALPCRTLPSTRRTPTSTRRASATSCPRSRRHAGWQGSRWRIAKRKGTKGENGFYTEFDTVLHRSPLSIGRSAGI